MGAGKIFKYLSRPASFSIPATTSNTSNKTAFSGPIVSIVPKEARGRKKKNSEYEEEPTSPKVSCIGQVNHKNNRSHDSTNNKKSRSSNSNSNKELKTKKHRSFNEREVSKKKGFLGLFKGKVMSPRQLEAVEEEVAAVEVGRMRRFASGRETLAGFDWKKAVAAEEEEDEEVIVAHSAPLVMGGGVAEVEKRKEVNLWKRRTLARPETLKVK